MQAPLGGLSWAATTCALLAFALAPPAGASSIPANTRLTLENHPDGSEASPFYGLRLDGLNGEDGDDVFTFDFEAPGAGVTLDYLVDGSDARIHIFGTVFGGLDVGSSHRDPQLFAIDFTYTDVQRGENDVLLFSLEGSGSGTITPLEFSLGGTAAGEPIQLVDEAGDNPFSFALLEDHRDFDGISGAGWLNHDALGDLETHIKHADWIFSARNPQPVPEPGTLVLMGLGLAGLARVRSRRSAAGAGRRAAR